MRGILITIENIYALIRKTKTFFNNIHFHLPLSFFSTQKMIIKLQIKGMKVSIVIGS